MTLATKLNGWLIRGKDSTSSLVAKKALDKAMERYGTMLNLNIDSRDKSLRIEILLKGEQVPLSVAVEEYELFNDASGSSILVKRVKASREWLDLLLNDFLRGKKLPIPEKYAGMMRMVL